MPLAQRENMLANSRDLSNKPAGRHTRACLWVRVLSSIRCSSRSVGIFLIDPPQEAEELLIAVVGLALSDHRPSGHIQRGKQGGGAMADGVMGDALHVTQSHGQQGLGAIEGLDLRFRVD